MIQKHPEPFVWFTEFGDNSLNFELHFWVEVRNVTERKRIESDLRFKVDQLFREAGIAIAFPQRDIYIDTERPIEVRVMPRSETDDYVGEGLLSDAA